MKTGAPPGPPHSRIPGLVRPAVLALLVAAPLALGSVHEPAYIPLLAVSLALGLASWFHAERERPRGVDAPAVPGRRLLLALHALVVAQLVPLPPRLLALVSPGSFSFYNDTRLVPLAEWRPITVSPADTARGLAFLAGMSLLYAAVFREFRHTRPRRRLAATIVGTGFFITLLALVQSGAGTTRIYGLWQPRWGWAVFGPYVNRNHFAGYMVMAIPVALAFAAEAAHELRQAWARRRVGWLALGEREGQRAIRRATVAMVLVVGLLASGSRGGAVAFAVSLTVLPLAFRHRRLGALVVALVAFVGVAWVGIDGIVRGFESRGIRTSRLELWQDAFRMAPHFPLLGSGLNAFGTAYPSHQTIWKETWIGEAHNEYLQALLDTGVAGAALTLALLGLLVGTAIRAAPASALDAGILGSLVASCAHNIVDFNWQIPANAATFVALAGLAMRGKPPHEDPRPI